MEVSIVGKDSFPKSTVMQGKKKTGTRPQSSGRYHSNTINSKQQAPIGIGSKFMTRNVGGQYQETSSTQGPTNGVIIGEHPEQPTWATRQNLKSKFNLMTSDQ